jgi:hypothetical protein
MNPVPRIVTRPVKAVDPVFGVMEVTLSAGGGGGVGAVGESPPQPGAIVMMANTVTTARDGRPINM